jgi:hypothetical protein
LLGIDVDAHEPAELERSVEAPQLEARELGADEQGRVRLSEEIVDRREAERRAETLIVSPIGAPSRSASAIACGPASRAPPPRRMSGESAAASNSAARSRSSADGRGGRRSTAGGAAAGGGAADGAAGGCAAGVAVAAGIRSTSTGSPMCTGRGRCEANMS